MKIQLPKQLRNVQDKDLIKVLEKHLEQIELDLANATAHTDPVAKDLANYLVSAGGKRVRPVLVLLAAQLGDPNLPAVNQAAVVVELTHLATLYHDDVMDEAPTRRGVPTAHQVWSNSLAILTGDLLFARASQVASHLGEEIIRLQAHTFERLCLGQMHETVGPKDGEDAVAHYIQVMADKTGSLIAASAHLGLMASNADPKYSKALNEYGEAIGVAFQLIDDVIDISDEGPSGKTPGTDLRAGVPTLPVLLLRKEAETSEEAKRLLSEIDGDLSSDETLSRVVKKLREHPVATEAETEAHRWAQKAIAALDSIPEGSTKRALISFAEAVVDRSN